MPTLCLVPTQSPVGAGRGPKQPTNVITFWNDIPYAAAKGLLPQYTTPPTAHITDGFLIAKWPRFDRGWIGDIVCFADLCFEVVDYISETILELDPLVPDHEEDDFDRMEAVEATAVVFTKQPDTNTEPALMGDNPYSSAYLSTSPAKKFKNFEISGSFTRRHYGDEVCGTLWLEYSRVYSGSSVQVSPSSRTGTVIGTQSIVFDDGGTHAGSLGVSEGSASGAFNSYSGIAAALTSAHGGAAANPTPVSTMLTRTRTMTGVCGVNPGFVSSSYTGEVVETLSVEDLEADAIARIPAIDWDSLPWNERDLLTTLDSEGWYQTWTGYSVYFKRIAGATITNFVYAPTKWKVEVSDLLPSRTYTARVKFSKRIVEGQFTHNEANMPFNTIGAWEDHDTLVVPFTTDVNGEATIEGDTGILYGYEIRIDEPEFLRVYS